MLYVRISLKLYVQQSYTFISSQCLFQCCIFALTGKGEFGDIFLSKAPGLFPDLEDDILVMVKSLDWPEVTEKR